MSATARVVDLAEVDVGRIRYGVFLRPSAALIQESLRAYRITAEQFGFRAANAYPPHITLVGSIALDPERSESDLVSAVDGAISGVAPIPIKNLGMALMEDRSILCQMIDHDAGALRLPDLMGALLDAVRPIRVFPSTDETAAQRQNDAPENFRAHLSLISHDGKHFPELSEECFSVLEEIGIGAPSEWIGEWVTLYRLESDDWTDRYWRTMTWEIVKSWKLT